MKRQLAPTGECWCGCGDECGADSFFSPGHDRKAETAVILVEYGGVAGLLAEHGYAPGGKNPKTALDRWLAAGNRPR